MLFGGAAPKRRAVTLQRVFNSHNNFLANAGYLTSNSTDFTNISVSKGYSHLEVYLFHGQTVSKRQYALSHCKPEKMNITHSSLSDS